MGGTEHPSGLARLWARQGRGQPAGQVLCGRPQTRLKPPALPLAPAPHGRVAEPAPSLPAGARIPAPDSPRARCLLQSRGRCPSQRRAQPTPPAASAREGKARQGGSDNGNPPIGSPEGLGGVARPRFRVGCTVRAPGRGLEGSAAAFLHCRQQLTCRGGGAGTPGRV